MPDKKVVLYSGGLDSTCLLYSLRDNFPDAEIYCLHFNYQQPNMMQELSCCGKNCAKVNASLEVMTIPQFSWTNSKFFDKDFDSVESQEVEFRNLVFLSYAISYAQSIGAREIYMATLASGGYVDTSTEFFEGVNALLKNVSDIQVITPYADKDKMWMANLVFYHNLTEDDFFTCDTPVNGKPCGKCPDCLAVKEILESAQVKCPAHQYCRSLTTDDEIFRQFFLHEPVTEARIYTNNVCQLHCKHCYYGFDDMKSEPLTMLEFEKMIDQCFDAGIHAFHFSGKEPLVGDGKVVTLTKYIKQKDPDAECTVVTNGLTLPKYAHELHATGISKVFVSIDSLSVGEYRNRDMSKVLEGVKIALEEGLQVQVFIDLSKDNYSDIYHILEGLYNDYSIREFYVRTVNLVGSAKGMKPLDVHELNHVYTSMRGFAQAYPDAELSLYLHHRYSSAVWDNFDGYEISDFMNNAVSYAFPYVSGNFIIHFELYCGRYENQITITPDGFVLGCASETASPNYDRISAGNVRDLTVKELIQIGKELAFEQEDHICSGCFKHCTFLNKTIDAEM